MENQENEDRQSSTTETESNEPGDSKKSQDYTLPKEYEAINGTYYFVYFFIAKGSSTRQKQICSTSIGPRGALTCPRLPRQFEKQTVILAISVFKILYTRYRTTSVKR